MAEVTKRGYKRAWLNPSKGLASADYGYTKWNSEAVDALFTIRDCTRTISLDFNYVNSKEHKEKIAKLDKLVELLEAFKKEVLLD